MKRSKVSLPPTIDAVAMVMQSPDLLTCIAIFVPLDMLINLMCVCRAAARISLSTLLEKTYRFLTELVPLLPVGQASEIMRQRIRDADALSLGYIHEAVDAIAKTGNALPLEAMVKDLRQTVLQVRGIRLEAHLRDDRPLWWNVMAALVLRTRFHAHVDVKETAGAIYPRYSFALNSFTPSGEQIFFTFEAEWTSSPSYDDWNQKPLLVVMKGGNELQISLSNAGEPSVWQQAAVLVGVDNVSLFQRWCSTFVVPQAALERWTWYKNSEEDLEFEEYSDEMEY